MASPKIVLEATSELTIPQSTIEPIEIGSLEHRDLLARVYRTSHVPFDVGDTRWPEVAPEVVEKLRSLPVWDEALRTENLTARLVQRYAEREKDPVLRDLIELQGYEEGRHASLVEGLVERYDICEIKAPVSMPHDLDMAFLRMGYRECLDSFFAFGLFEIARSSGLFPPELITIFEPLLQEEARHILFFVNWVAWHRARRGLFGRMAFHARCELARAHQLWDRVRGRLGLEPDHFTKGHTSIDIDLEPRAFLDLCLAEHERRLAVYDARLLRPRLVPGIVRRVRQLWR